MKAKFTGKRGKNSNNRELMLTSKRNFTINSHYENYAKARRLLHSQYSKRTRNYSPNNSIPIPRNSISSHEKSTENSLHSYESGIKSRIIRPKSIRMIIKNKKNLSVTRLIEELSEQKSKILSNIITIQKYFKGYLTRKKYKLMHNIEAKRVILNHKQFIIFLIYHQDSITIEAFNTENVIQLSKYNINTKDLCNSLNLPYDN